MKVKLPEISRHQQATHRVSESDQVDCGNDSVLTGDYKYPTLIDSRSPELGIAGGSVEMQEDGDSYALVSAMPMAAGMNASGVSSLYLYLRGDGGLLRRNVQLRFQ